MFGSNPAKQYDRRGEKKLLTQKLAGNKAL